MTNVQLRKQIKKSVDAIPTERLVPLVEFIAFLSRPPLRERLARAKRDIAAGKGTPWRSVRRDV